MLPASGRKSKSQMSELLHHTVKDKAVAAYWGLAIGDALGATLEFMTPREIRHHYVVHDKIVGGGWLRLPAGQVTDDTQMSLALGDAIIEQGGVDALAIGQSFDRWLRSKPVDVGQTVRSGIINFRKTGNIHVKPNRNGAGNGACMRTLPIALLTLGQQPQQIQSSSRLQAHITHNNELSDAACELVIHLIHGAIYGADKNELLHGPIAEFISRYPVFNFRQQRMENPGAYIVETMIAVLQAFIDTEDFHQCLVDVVNRGGDADTTGAIAGMIAGAYYGSQAIPKKWIYGLNNEVRDNCQQQAKALLSMNQSIANTINPKPAGMRL